MAKKAKAKAVKQRALQDIQIEYSRVAMQLGETEHRLRDMVKSKEPLLKRIDELQIEAAGVKAAEDSKAAAKAAREAQGKK